MSLEWDVTEIDNYDKVTYVLKDGEDVWNPVTTALVMHTIGICIGQITKDNAAEVYSRISFVETLYGPSLSEGGSPRPITPLDVRDHIGLRVNVRQETRAVFLKRHTVPFLDAGQREYGEALTAALSS